MPIQMCLLELKKKKKKNLYLIIKYDYCTRTHIVFSWFMETSHRDIDFCTNCICLTVYPLTLKLPITENVQCFLHFQKKKHHLVWFIRCFAHGNQKKYPQGQEFQILPLFVGIFCPHNVGFTRQHTHWKVFKTLWLKSLIQMSKSVHDTLDH